MNRHLIALFLAPLCGAFLLGPAQAQKTKAQLTTEVGTTFPDNIIGAITPLGVRTYELDVLNSIMPTAPVTAGNLACFDGTTGLLKDCAYAPNTLIIGTTAVSSATSKGILFSNSGVLQNTNAAAGAILVTDAFSAPAMSATPTIGVPGASVGSISFANTTSGTVTVQTASGALGSAVASLPAGTYTFVGDSIAQTLTNKTINGASNTLTVRLASDVTGNLPLANIATGTQDTVLGYWGSTTASAIAVSNCTGALTYSTATHTFGCNASAGTGTVTSVTCFGSAITTTGTCTIAATQADQQAASSTTAVVTPYIQSSHDSAAKAFVRFTGSTGAITGTAYNVSSVSRSAAGTYTLNFTNSFANTSYGCVITPEDAGQTVMGRTNPSGKTTTAQPLFVVNLTPTTVDPTAVTVVCYGRQ